MARKEKTKKKRSMETRGGRGRELIGTVTSVKMQNTVVIEVKRSRAHPVYKKLMRTKRKFLAHLPESLKVETGDEVKIKECRPISKNKRWIVVSKE